MFGFVLRLSNKGALRPLPTIYGAKLLSVCRRLHMFQIFSVGYGGHDGPGYPDGPPHYDDRHPADDRGPRYKRDRSPPPRDRESDRVERVGSPDRKRQRNESDRRSRSRERERDREVCAVL